MGSPRVAVAVILLALGLPPPGCVAQAPTPPGQPATGPGGSDYPHAGYDRTRWGRGADECWIFTPAGPQPASAPVVVFCHEWLAMVPAMYEAWVTHLVRRGNIVIFPRYQVGARTPAGDFTPNAAGAVRDALVRLKGLRVVLPQTDRFALVGHSAGGVVAANLAATWQTVGLPRPRALMCVEPARSLQHNSTWGIPPADYSALPADMLLLCVVGAEDHLAGSETARDIFTGARLIPPANKNLVTVQSDRHGEPPLVADHDFIGGQIGGGALNALAYYGPWKLFDALTDAAFSGKNRDCALGNTPPQRFMGAWSDGAPVKELVVE